MGHRNIVCPNQMLDLNVDQRNPSYFHPDPRFPLRSASNILQPTLHPTNFDGHHLPDHHDGGLFYGRSQTQYERVQHHRPIGNPLPYMPQASSNRILPVSLNYGSSDHLTSVNNYGNVGVSDNEYGRHGHFMDGDRGSYKRKNAGNLAASSSSSSNSMPQFVGNASSSSLREVGSNERNRAGAPGFEHVTTHNYNRMVQGNYMDQAFGPSDGIWFDRQAGSSCIDGSTTSAWTSVPNLPYPHGNNIIGGSMETADMGVPWYNETANNRTSASFPPPPPVNLRHQNALHPVAPVPGLRSQNSNFLPPAAMASYRIPSNYVSRNTVNHSQDGVNMLGLRQQAVSIPPAGLRTSRQQRMGVAPHTALRHRSFPLRVLPSDEVAMLEISQYYEMRNSIDHHRDMRLDIEHMSYEELLALEEQIGSVSIGLSKETINCQLKTRTHLSSANRTILKELAGFDQDSDSCIICQEEYKKKEKIGTLSCGHEYHADCLTKWLLVKNVCPICKSEGLSTESKQ
ncbi:hypothetical protein ACFE04_022621 [Oxalis oulophora]